MGVDHQVNSRFIKEMRCFLGLFALFALLSFVMTSEVNVMSPRKEDDVCFKCAKSYYDCFKLFGKTGCTAKNAEHHSWCLNALVLIRRGNLSASTSKGIFIH